MASLILMIFIMQLRIGSKRREWKKKQANRKMGPKSGIQLTGHAIDRYRERYCPNLSVEEARTEVMKEIEGASPTKNKSVNNDEIWISENGVRFVVKRDAQTRVLVCTTILEPDNSNQILPPQEIS